MPIFSAGSDPGANFGELLKRVGISPFSAQSESNDLTIPHATTCVAMCFSGGVVMAGDRRATSGNLISHRSMERLSRPMNLAE